MLVECIKMDDEGIYETSFNKILNLGELYVVYGIHFDTIIKFEILPYTDSRHTTEAPSTFFRIIDNRISRHFIFGSSFAESYRAQNNNTRIPFLSFKEWATDDTFFSKLIEGEVNTRNIFNKYISSIKLEYKLPNVNIEPLKLGENYFQCLECNYISNEVECLLNEMVECPQCKKLYKNV